MKYFFKLIFLSIIILLIQLPALAKINDPRSVWMMVPSPLKIGLNSQKTHPENIWLHKPSQIMILDIVEDYLPKLSKKDRIEAYCSELKSHFVKIDTFKSTKKFCLIVGTALGKPMMGAAILNGTNQVRHFTSDLSEIKMILNKDHKSLSTFLDDISELLTGLST